MHQKEILEKYENGNIKTVWLKNKELLIGYYDNGRIKYEQEFNGNKAHGETKHYSLKGNLKKIVIWDDGIAHGTIKKFFENGQLKEKGQYKDGKPYGSFYYYDQQGKHIATRHYIIKEGRSYLNEVFRFNKGGDTLKNASNYYTIYALNSKKDTFQLGDSLFYFIELEAPYYKDSVAFFTGNFSNDYILKDSTSLIRWMNDEFHAVIGVKAKKLGTNYIRGVINNYNDTSHRDQFFEIEFYVVDSIQSSISPSF